MMTFFAFSYNFFHLFFSTSPIHRCHNPIFFTIYTVTAPVAKFFVVTNNKEEEENVYADIFFTTSLYEEFFSHKLWLNGSQKIVKPEQNFSSPPYLYHCVL